MKELRSQRACDPPEKLAGQSHAVELGQGKKELGGEQIRIVALGASGTYGKGVAREEAFPARIEALLRAEGYDVLALVRLTGKGSVDFFRSNGRLIH